MITSFYFQKRSVCCLIVQVRAYYLRLVHVFLVTSFLGKGFVTSYQKWNDFIPLEFDLTNFSFQRMFRSVLGLIRVCSGVFRTSGPENISGQCEIAN